MIKLIWKQRLQFIAEDEHNHRIVVDTDREFGGLDEGIRPMQFVLVALTGCMAMDIVSILQKKGGKIRKFEVTAKGEKVVQHPKKYAKITLKFICEGVYKRADLLRSFELSRDSYCSVLATLKSPPEIEFII